MTSRINGELYSAIQAYSKQNGQTAKQRGVDSSVTHGIPEDRIDLSPKSVELAKELSIASRIIREAGIPELSPARDAKIHELAQRVKQGTYKPPIQEIAYLLAPAIRRAEGDDSRN